ncbi:unnamed protein product [Cylindrotheca closterium]|uniref:Uncharacterized protein n=1 Tax=Cylindrotheca closterium TaxID=2856 RepID=A0AAD2G512_9STRA|nr:unnamed protein product [Cylindrotheca closterium]
MKPRVPLALQQVFTKSSSGEDVQRIQPPKNGLGFKVFQRKGEGKISVNIKSLIGRTPMKATKAMKATKESTTSTSRNDAPTITRSSSIKSIITIESASDSYRKANPITEKKKRERKSIDTPQGFFEAALEERGYSTEKYVTIESAYYCRPTPLQKASYGTRMNEAILKSDATLLRRLLDSGLSPNPCNDFGESLVHRICRRGDHKLLRVLLENGCCLQIADDYGRTPLHDALWKAEPSEEILNLILRADRDLIRLMDCRGFVPLEYVRKASHTKMIEYLTRSLDKFFPHRDGTVDRPPILTKRQPHSTPVPDPGMALLPHTAALVANGEIEPEDALHWDDSSFDDSSYEDDSELDSDDDDSYYSETQVSADLDLEFDEAAIMELCIRVGGPIAVSKHCLAKKSPTTARSFARNGPMIMSNPPDLSKDDP